MVPGFHCARESAQQIFLVRIKMYRRFNRDPAEKIANLALSHGFDPFPFEAKYFTGLCFRWDLQRHAAVERRYVKIPPQGRGNKTDRNFAIKIRSLARNIRCFFTWMLT